MKVNIVATICADIHVSIPEIYDSDTIGDYCIELDAAIQNAALDHLVYGGLKKSYDSIEINYASVDHSDYEAVEEYSNILNNWYESSKEL